MFNFSSRIFKETASYCYRYENTLHRVSYEIVIEDKNMKREVLMDQNGNLPKDDDEENDKED